MTPILKVGSILLAIIAGSLVAVGVTARAEIKIGVFGPMTDDPAGYARMKGSGADVMVEWSHYAEGALISKQMKRMDYDMLHFASKHALRPEVLSPEAERALEPKQTFKECATCPEMVVMPAGSFMMGSPESEKGRNGDEGPQHRVTFAKAFAVSKYEATFDEWDACVALGGCGYTPGDEGWGRGAHPVIQVSWDDVQQYVAWLSRQTGKPYRLLSEAEWEYAARAGSDTAYPWGDEIGERNVNSGCVIGCRTAPVGSFPPNAFGLHDMHGNVWEWVQDCYHFGYDGAPTDGSANTTGGCNDHVQRSGSWGCEPQCVRSAVRFGGTNRSSGVGFRVGRTLTP